MLTCQVQQGRVCSLLKTLEGNIMGFFDRMITGTKNLANREVRLYSQQNGFLLEVKEHGFTRQRCLSKQAVDNLQERLWDKDSLKAGIVMKFAPDPDEFSNKFEIPAWAMQRLRDDMLNERVHLTVTQ